MKMTIPLISGLLIAAAPVAAQMAPMAHNPSSAMPMPGMKTMARDYVPAAGAGDLYERMSSELVLKTTNNPKVRMFAQMMLNDHSKTTMQVTAAAKASGMMPMPPKLMPKQLKMITDLKAAPMAKRDKLYLDQQMMAHREALALHQGYASGGDKPALVKVATAAVPIVQHHLDEVTRLAGM